MLLFRNFEIVVRKSSNDDKSTHTHFSKWNGIGKGLRQRTSKRTNLSSDGNQVNGDFGIVTFKWEPNSKLTTKMKQSSITLNCVTSIQK